MLLGTFGVGAAITGCGGGGGGGGFLAASGNGAVVAVAFGNGQTGNVGTALAQPLAAIVTDASGNPVRDATVTFAAATGGGSVSPASVKTSAAGLAATTATLGPAPGANTFRATVALVGSGTGTAIFTATGVATSVASLVATAGNGASGPVATALPPLVVTARDANGNAMANVPVSFAVTSGGGGVAPAGATTDAQGLAQTVLTLPTTAGTVVVNATAIGTTTSATFTLTATPAAAARLAFSVQPATVPATAFMIPDPKVVVQDSFGNTVSTVASISISLGSLGGGGTLYVASNTVVTQAGVATIRSVSVSAGGLGYSLLASSPGLASATSAPFNVKAIEAADGLGHLTNGQMDFGRATANDAPGPNALKQPNGVAVDVVGHRLFVADTSNHRVLVFALQASNALASRTAFAVLGQSVFTSGTSGGSGANALSSPSGLAFDAARDRLFVCDAGNNRVVVYDLSGGLTSGMNASVVLGQAGFGTSASGNAADQMSAPRGVALDGAGDRLFVADNLNNRVLVFATTNLTSGQAAFRVLGQAGFGASAAATSQTGMNAPFGVAYDGTTQRLYVVEAGNNRVVVFDFVASPLVSDGQGAQFELGQPAGTAFTSATATATTTGGLNAPTGVAVGAGSRLYVADSQDHRTLVFDVATIANGEDAVAVLGQTSFTGTSSAVAADRQAFPASLTHDGSRTLFVCELVNARVTTFDTTTIQTSGQAATDGLGHLVAGGTSLTSRQQNDVPGASAFDTTNDLALDKVHHLLFVSDLLNHRVLAFQLSAQDDFTNQSRSASFVLGQKDFTTNVAAITSSGLNSPNGLFYDPTKDRLFIADRSNNRVIVHDFTLAPLANGRPADFELGQPAGVNAFTTGTANTGGISSATLAGPGCVHVDTGTQRLFVSDCSNNRVLVHDLSSGITNGMPASFELGVPAGGGAFTTVGSGPTSASNFRNPSGLAYDAAKQQLYLADFSNSRVLVFDFNATPLANGVSASFVLGQPDLTTNAPATTRTGMSTPLNLALDTARKRLYVTEQINNRVSVYDVSALGPRPAQAMSVLGQASFTSQTAGTGRDGLTLNPTPNKTGAFVDVAAGRLFVSDAQNHRVLVFDVR